MGCSCKTHRYSSGPHSQCQSPCYKTREYKVGMDDRVPAHKRIAQQLAAMREARGLSLAQVSAAMKRGRPEFATMSRQWVHNAESGDHEAVHLPRMEAAAAAVGGRLVIRIVDATGKVIPVDLPSELAVSAEELASINGERAAIVSRLLPLLVRLPLSLLETVLIMAERHQIRTERDQSACTGTAG